MKDNRGFTLAELLIVVAIIGVLVAISIPIFMDQLEKSRESTDAAEIRNAYAAVMTNALSMTKSPDNGVELDGKKYKKSVILNQKNDEWQDEEVSSSLDMIAIQVGKPAAGGVAVIVYDPTIKVNSIAEKKNQVTITYENASGTVSIDYDKTQSVGKYAFSQLVEQLNNYNSGQTVQTEISRIMKSQTDKAESFVMTLPNGSTVNVVMYNRSYDYFDSPAARLTENTVSVIYNRNTGNFSTVMYYNGKDGNTESSYWTNSQSNSNYNAWSDDNAWGTSTTTNSNKLKDEYKATYN